MRAIQLDFADPTFPVSLVESDDPPLPSSDWARISVTGGGICGSDLHIFQQTTGISPVLASLAMLPMQVGHEIAGVVIEAGPKCPLKPGTRVAVDSVIGCVARGIEPLCPQCAAGVPSACHSSILKAVVPGFQLGFSYGLGGGWGDQVLAHASMLHPLPDAVPEVVATLHEPVSIAVHGLMRQPPQPGEPVLVAGAGIIGLCTVATLRALFPTSEVTVLAKHDHQAQAAEALGAKRVVRLDPDGRHIEELARVCRTAIVGFGSDAMLVGGFPYVVEAVGTPQSVTQALRFVDGRGTMLLLGVSALVEVDLSPIWFKEVALVGAVNHGPDRGLHGGAPSHSIDRAIQILASGRLPADVVISHQFPLTDYRRAIETALDRAGARTIKVVLRP